MMKTNRRSHGTIGRYSAREQNVPTKVGVNITENSP